MMPTYGQWWLIVGLSAACALLVLLVMPLCARLGERESDRADEAEDVGLDILNPRRRSTNFDATGEQLTGWNVVHEGHAMRTARLQGMSPDELRNLAHAQGIRGFDTMGKQELVAALGGTPIDDATTQELPRRDDDTLDLDHITYATAHVAPSPTIGDRMRRDAPTQPQRLMHEHGRLKGDTTLMFEGFALHEGHPVREHGPDEHTIQLTRCAERGGWPAMGLVTT